MKFKKKGKKEEKVVALSLKEFNDEVILKGKDKYGEDWDIMYFKNGRFERAGGINENIGIDVNIEGKIKEI